jgi:hypothetical protein
MTIALISCTKEKLGHAAPAGELYTSQLFRKSLSYARSLQVDRVFVLSAKHGLVPLERVLEPYDESLLTKRAAERWRWATMVLDQMHDAGLDGARFILLAGRRYTENLVPYITSEDPLKGLGMGQRLRFLTERNH